MSKFLVVAVVAGIASVASADVILETEPNDTLGTADFIGDFNAPGGSVVVDGSISGAAAPDQDWFRFTVSDAAQIVIATFGRPNSNVGDSYLELYDSQGVLLAEDDDDGIRLFSALEYNGGPGTYFIRVRAFELASPGEQFFDYKMVVGLNIVPTPGALAFLGVGALAAARRRR